MNSSYNSSRPRRIRTKTFSGCWTCRAKHVKCDETRPRCSRCQRAGIDCEGYGVRLSWTSVRGPSNFRTTRQSARQVSSLIANQPSPQRLESESEHDQELEYAPPRSDGPDGPEDSRPSPSVDTFASASHHQSAPSDLDDGQLPSNANPASFRSYPSTTLGDAGASASYPDITWLPQSQNSQIVVPTYHDSPEERQGSDAEPGAPVLRHLDMLPHPSLQSQLIEQWTLFLCDALSPVPGIHNPLRTILIPIALEGARADASASTGATALFHLVCAASGFQLAQTKESKHQRQVFEHMALEHHNLGITHLGQNIQSDDRSQCVPLLAALVMCLFCEGIEMPSSFWRLHMRGAVEWLNHINPQVWRQTESASTIYQMFTGFAVLIQSQLLLDDRGEEVWDLAYNPTSEPDPYVLDVVLGIPKPLLQGINAMNSLLREVRRQGGPSEQIDARKADRLEIELYLAVPSKPSGSLSRQDRHLVYNYGYVFYYGALVYMKRCIKNVPLQEVQGLIEQALEYLEAMGKVPEMTRPYAPMIWPVAIIAFDAAHPNLQQRVLGCFEAYRECSQLAIWGQLAEMAKSIWALRNTEDNTNLQWHKSSLVTLNESLMMM